MMASPPYQTKTSVFCPGGPISLDLDDVDVGADADADDDVFLLEFNDRDDREETSELERKSNRTKELQKEKS